MREIRGNRERLFVLGIAIGDPPQHCVLAPINAQRFQAESPTGLRVGEGGICRADHDYSALHLRMAVVVTNVSISPSALGAILRASTGSANPETNARRTAIA